MALKQEGPGSRVGAGSFGEPACYWEAQVCQGQGLGCCSTISSYVTLDKYLMSRDLSFINCKVGLVISGLNEWIN